MLVNVTANINDLLRQQEEQKIAVELSWYHKDDSKGQSVVGECYLATPIDEVVHILNVSLDEFISCETYVTENALKQLNVNYDCNEYEYSIGLVRP